MARRATLAGGLAAAAVVALAVAGLLLLRAARADVAVEVVPPPRPTLDALVARPGRSGRIELRARPFPRVRDSRFFLRVGLSTNRPESRFVLELRAGEGAVLGRCEYAPGGYRVDRYSQSTRLACPVGRPDSLRIAILEATHGPVTVPVRRRADGRLEGGGLLAGQPRGVGAALERLSVARAGGLGAATLFLSLAGSAAALVAALALLGGRDREP